ncbi:MAG: aspartate--tRNA ligase [Spirochaetales bacterium]|nr:aspartate--tRNA ligase [Spirochaetales bacterium]
MNKYRTHTCGELRKDHIGKEVTIAGWVNNKRDHGGVLFVDLRDHYGLTQVVIRPESGILDSVSALRKETVVQFEGFVEMRDEETKNLKIPTGEIDLAARRFEVLGECESLPFSIFPEEEAPEETRLSYRYLDLRKSKLHENIVLRSKVISSIRKHMEQLGFHEYQTPILTASSPEGARDYLVPSRLHPGKFYALPQAPQLYKQLLMVAGFDRYFQIAPCFRDEDARATRSPGEFYQLDLEMSFVTQDDVFAVIEYLFPKIFSEFSNATLTKTPFPRIPYKEAMLKYGSDKPDLRNPIEIYDVTDIFKASEFQAFKKIVDKGGIVRAMTAKGIASQPKSFFENMLAFAQSIGSQGLAYLVFNETEVKGPVAKVLPAQEMELLKKAGGIETGDVMFFVANKERETVRIAGEIRTKLGEELHLLDANVFQFCWITDYPMFELDETGKKIMFSHNPFSMPQGGMDALLNEDPLTILAYQYDIVCNGIELSSGAIRNHQPEIMYKAFEIAGYSKEEVDSKFSALIKAFHYGAPPHGGIAPGIDRMIMLLAGEDNIREVIAFPMNQKAQEPMINTPREVSKEQLRELHIKTAEPAVKKKDEQ